MTMTTASLHERAHPGGVNEDDIIDPAARPTRRTFSAGYKAEILAEYDLYPKGSDERGAILRREGLYSSHISEWRKQADAGAREGLARRSKKRRTAEQVELERLRRRNDRLEAELAKMIALTEIPQLCSANSPLVRCGQRSGWRVPVVVRRRVSLRAWWSRRR